MKGDEADNVMILDDLSYLVPEGEDSIDKRFIHSPAEVKFPHDSRKDDLNFFYVAVTRAKILSVSPKFMKAYDFLRGLPDFQRTEDDYGFEVDDTWRDVQELPPLDRLDEFLGSDYRQRLGAFNIVVEDIENDDNDNDNDNKINDNVSV